MRRSVLALLWVAVAVQGATSSITHAGQPVLTTELVVSGLSSPLFLTHAPGDASRLFVLEKRGAIRVIQNGVLLTTPFLDIDPLVNSTTLEWGLLGMAFHPSYASNGFFYINYIDNNGDAVIARYQVSADPNVASPASAQTVLFIDQPNENHRGGWLGFGPDGYLYDSQGDGGPQNDPNNRGQNINLLLGKILRLDVNGDDFPADANRNYAIPPTNPFVGVAGEDEIWAYGLRNPWRCSFDRATGDLWIADVGQNQIEEIDFQPASSPGGANYGWRCMEGTQCTGMSGCTCNSPALTNPIYEYTHALGVSITGGYVYHGAAIPDLRGTYFFADYQSARIWSLRYSGVVTEFQERTTELDPPGALSISTIASFGEDAQGELYMCDLSGGEIFKIASTLIDCNGNGIADDQDISGGTSQDCNSNAIPDECDLSGGTSLDCNANTVPDECDIAGGASADCQPNGTPDECEADCNGNGVPDDCDISSGTSGDCDGNATPDECQTDCDGDGIPDACELTVVAFQDNFETDQGWTVASINLIDGAWERADPTQTLLSGNVAQPEDDNPGGTGTLCYVTDRTGPVTSLSDVDGGPTRLISPALDLTAGPSRLDYAYWFFTQNGTPDSLVVEVSNNDGASWVVMSTHNAGASAWRASQAFIDDYVQRTATMRFRFSVADAPNDSTTEALIDDVVVVRADCAPPQVPGDCNGDGLVDIADFARFSDCFAGSGVALGAGCVCVDMDQDGDVDLRDFAQFQAAYDG